MSGQREANATLQFFLYISFIFLISSFYTPVKVPFPHQTMKPKTATASAEVRFALKSGRTSQLKFYCRK